MSENSLRRTVRGAAIGFLAILLWGGALEIAYEASAQFRIVGARPSQVLAKWLQLSGERELWLALQSTLRKLLIAVAISVCAGYPLGFLVGLSQGARPLITTPLNAFRAIPAAVLTPIFMIAVGFGEDMIIAMATFPSLAMILVGVSEAVSSEHGSRRSICRALGMTRWQRIRHCIFWESLAKGMLVLIAALPMTVALIVALEYFDLDDSGLGYWVSKNRQMRGPGNLATTYAAVLWVGILGIAATYLPKLLEAHFQRWMK